MGLLVCYFYLVALGGASSRPDCAFVAVGATLLFLGQTSLGPISRSFAIAGWQKVQMWWDLGRLVSVAAVVALVHEGSLLVALGGVILISSMIFIWYGLSRNGSGVRRWDHEA